jgi:DHA1 family bicyclomycin/chloramphenicol resistance-like MFS transporter
VRLLMLAAATGLGSLSIDLYLPAFPALAREMGGSEASVQVTLTACVIGLAVGQLVAGPLSDAIGRRTPITLGLLGWSITSFLCALAPSMTTLTLLRFAQGLAGSAGIVVARAVVRDLAAGDQLVRAFARLMLVVGVVPILAPTVGGLMLRVMSWRWLFVVLGVLGAIFAVALHLGLRESLPPAARRRGGVASGFRSYRELLHDRGYVGAALVVGFTFAALFTYVSSSSFVFIEAYGLDTAQFGLMFATSSVALVSGTQLSGLLSGRLNARRHLLLAIVVAALAAVALLGLTEVGRFGVFGAAAPIVLMVFGIGMAMPVASSLAMSRHPERAGAASALLGLFQFTVGGVVAPSVGAIGTGSVMPMAVAVLSCLLVALALQTFAARRELRRS